jgi:imidazolonepropionase-like amidohydrolase
MSPEELSACVAESHRFGLEVTAHAYGGLSVDQCLEAGVDCIEHGFFMSSRQYARGADLGRWVVPTLGVFLAEPGIPDFLTGRRRSASASCAQGRRRGNPLRCSKPQE